MKLIFNFGMRFIFGYGKEIHPQGPVYDWHVTEDISKYFDDLLAMKITIKGRKYNNHNVTQYIKFNTIKQL